MIASEFIDLESIEYEAATDFFRAAPQGVRERYSIDSLDIGGANCLHSRDLEPAMVFRRAVGLGVETTASEASLDRVVRHMAGRGDRFAVPVAPGARPAQLPAWLEARGFTRGYAWMKFSRSCVDLPETSTDLDIRVIGEDMATEFARVIAGSFGLPDATRPWMAALCGRPGWVCTLARDGEIPVAAGAAYVRGRHAWLGFGGTLSAHRKLGAQTALLAVRLREVAARGAQVAVTETGERMADAPNHSYRNILRAGFVERYLRQNYLSPG